MARKRPIKGLLNVYKPGQGKAQVVDTPSQLSYILFVSSFDDLGRRNVTFVWMHFDVG